MIAAFFWLIFAHLLADYPLQGEFLANFKGKNPIILVSHAGIWTGTIVFALKLLGYHPDWIVVSSLFLIHGIADVLKARNLLWYKRLDSLKGGLLIDQLIHVAQIIVALQMV